MKRVRRSVLSAAAVLLVAAHPVCAGDAAPAGDGVASGVEQAPGFSRRGRESRAPAEPPADVPAAPSGQSPADAPAAPKAGAPVQSKSVAPAHPKPAGPAASKAIAPAQPKPDAPAASKVIAPAQPKPVAPAAPEAAEEAKAGPEIVTLGENGRLLHLVDHGGGKWSMHAENLDSKELLWLWREGGGPEFVYKNSVDRQYTLSLHKLSSERIVERLLEGYSYTLHYDDHGRLVRVRVYSLQPSFTFKTPRLVESLAKWREAETSPDGPAETH